MSEDIEATMGALIRAIRRTEEHIADKQELLATLRTGRQNTRRGGELWKLLTLKIAYHTERMAALHAERDALKQQMTKLRRR